MKSVILAGLRVTGRPLRVGEVFAWPASTAHTHSAAQPSPLRRLSFWVSASTSKSSLPMSAFAPPLPGEVSCEMDLPLLRICCGKNVRAASATAFCSLKCFTKLLLRLFISAVYRLGFFIIDVINVAHFRREKSPNLSINCDLSFGLEVSYVAFKYSLGWLAMTARIFSANN